MAIKAFNENSKPTKTSKFMNLLIKFGIFPITFDGDKVQVKMMSLKTFFHFIILNGLTLFSQITSMQDFSLSTATTIDWITIIIIQSCTLVVTNIPLVISFGLNNLDKKVIQNNSFPVLPTMPNSTKATHGYSPAVAWEPAIMKDVRLPSSSATSGIFPHRTASPANGIKYR